MSQSTPSAGRPRLFPDDVEPVQLHRGAEPLHATISRCEVAGWKVIEMDAGGWADGDRLHDDVSSALAFPDRYGRNLDALVDELRSLPHSSDPDLAGAAGLTIVLNRIDELVTTDPLRAQDLIEIFVEGALGALRYGWPIAILLQSDDPTIQLAQTAATTIPWNRAERNVADRA